MSNITPTPPSFTFGYWRPWKENSDHFDSYLDYVKDVSLAKYQADTVGKYISQASSDQIQAIGELGDRIGLASFEQIQAIEQASFEQVQAIEKASFEQVIAIKKAAHQQVQAIGELGQKIERGLFFLSYQMSEVNQQLFFLNKNLDIQIEQQKVTNLLLENISELLRVPDSEKERQHSIELGLKFFVNAQKDDDLFADALEELLEAEKLMKQDYFVLHRIGLIYMYSLKHINPQMALAYFEKAAKYASVESDLKAVRLANALTLYGKSRVNTRIVTETNAIGSLAADSYEKAAFAAYVLGNFELAVTHQSKAVKFNHSAENYFFLAKYQTRTNQVDLCLQNLEKSIDENPSIFYAVFKDIDLINEPEVLKLIEEKNNSINMKILHLRKEFETYQNDAVKPILLKLENLINHKYDKKVDVYSYYIESTKRNWAVENLNVNYFVNGDEIPEAINIDEWTIAGEEKKPAWCYYENDQVNGEKYGKLYNWYAVNDSRGLAPLGWHIPSKEEWDDFINLIGGEKIAGLKMKSKLGWDEEYGNGTDEIGFVGLPGGQLFGHEFRALGKAGQWWSSTSEEEKTAYIITIGFGNEIYALPLDKNVGISVRCISAVSFDFFKNRIIDNQIYRLINEFESMNTSSSNSLVSELKNSLTEIYQRKKEVLEYACQSPFRNYFTSNLNIRNFRNGDSILEARTLEEWIEANNSKISAWCYYDFNPQNGREYGKLYNWYAVNDPRGLAPEGWRIPEHEDLEIINQNKGDFYYQRDGGNFSRNGFNKDFSNWWLKSSPNDLIGILSAKTIWLTYQNEIEELHSGSNDGLPVRCIRE